MVVDLQAFEGSGHWEFEAWSVGLPVALHCQTGLFLEDRDTEKPPACFLLDLERSSEPPIA